MSGTKFFHRAVKDSMSNIRYKIRKSGRGQSLFHNTVYVCWDNVFVRAEWTVGILCLEGIHEWALSHSLSMNTFFYIWCFSHTVYLGGLSWYISSDRYILLFNRDDNTVNKLLETPALWLGRWQQLQKLQDQAERQTQALENLFAGFSRAALSLPHGNSLFSEWSNKYFLHCMWALCTSSVKKTIPSIVKQFPLWLGGGHFLLTIITHVQEHITHSGIPAPECDYV